MNGRRKAIYVGAFAALFLMLLGAWGVRSILQPREKPVEDRMASIALVDIRKAVEAHPAMAELSGLQKEEEQLRGQLREALSYQPSPIAPPSVDGKPFQDAVWQKNAQNVIGAAAEIMREKKRAAEAYRKDSEASYRDKRDALDAEYLNAILNIQLKLQNQDNLHLSPDTVAELEAQRDALQRERGERQMQLARQWEQEIMAYAEEAVRERKEKLRSEAQASKAALEEEAVTKQVDAQTRNAAAMDAALQVAQERQKKREQIMESLQKTTQERIALESHILSDIAGQAARLAILHHYTMVLADPAFTLRGRLPWQKWQGAPPEKYAKVIGIGTPDLTDELVEEIKKSL